MNYRVWQQSFSGFYTHQKNVYTVIYKGQDLDLDLVPKVWILIRPKRSRFDRIQIRNTAVRGCLSSRS
jgi:hypothetical protein